jgi:hypothetical protein
MFSGGLIGLVSGGKIDVGGRRAEKRERKLDRKESRFDRKESRFERRHGPNARMGMYQSSPRASLGDRVFGGFGSGAHDNEQEPDYFNRGSARRGNRRDRRGAARGGGVIGAVKKVMQEDVLYLMIVPMPSEAELAEAREMLAREK